MNYLPSPMSCELLARRVFLRQAANTLGATALASLLSPALSGRVAAADSDPLRQSRGILSPLHHAPKIKRVIILTMAGGPSHLETFDYKPKLEEMHGKPM